MEGYVWRDGKIATSAEELDRQYRLIKQTLAMHHSLRDSYRRRATLAEIILLAASVVFLLTTFADSNFYRLLGLATDVTKLVLGLASAVAFLSSLVLLLLDWPGKAASHKDSAQRWFVVLSLFRDARLEDGSWPIGQAGELSAAYAEVCRNTVPIPDRMFNTLKVQYLTKVEVSRIASKYPGAPYFLLWMLVRLSATSKAIRNE